MRTRAAFTAAFLTVAVLGACSSDPPKSTPTSTQNDATTTTATPAALAELYQERGPFPVGVMTVTLPQGNLAEIWYPAVKGTSGTETYDVHDFTAPAISALLTADVDATITDDAARDADAAEGSFPLVLFSHGFSGFRLQSTFLTSHLASWGMIVAAPDHPSRDLMHLLGTPVAQDSVDDVQATLDAVRAANDEDGGTIAGRVDLSQIAAVGHSAGGGTVAAATNRIADIDGYVSLASGLRFGSRASTSVGSTTTTMKIPAKPSLFIAGALDQVVSPTEVTEASFRLAAMPTRLWVIDKAGHNAFDDLCRLGNGAGIIGVAEASGLGPALSSGPLAGVKSLGEDGCKPPNVKVDEVYPAIRHAVVAWLRELFGVDATAQGLGPEVGGEFGVSVKIEERLG